MNAIPGRRTTALSRWLVYFAALLVALGATALLLRAGEQPAAPTTPTMPAAAPAQAAPAAPGAPGDVLLGGSSKKVEFLVSSLPTQVGPL